MIRFALFAAAAVPLTLVFSLISLVGGLLRAPAGLHDWVHRWWSRILLRIAGVRVHTEGLEHVEPGAPQVIVANHQSILDIPALFATLPVSLRFVAKRELSRVPVFAHAMRQAGHVFIERSSVSQAIRRMREAGRRMKEQRLALGLFPEGTRSPDGRLRSFHKGTFVLAIQTQTRIVPVAVEGGARILPKGEPRLRPGVIHVRCGRPISLEGLGRDDRDRLVERTREAVAGMLEEIRASVRVAASGGTASGGRDGRPEVSAEPGDSGADGREVLLSRWPGEDHLFRAGGSRFVGPDPVTAPA